ncbi:aspartic peptidase A1, partial [Mycena rebaudengoi]
MFPSLVLTVLLSLNVAATPVVIDSFVTLPLSRKANFTGTRTLLSRDLARARHLRARAEAKLSGRAVINEPLDNQAVGYISPSRHGEFKHVDWVGDPLRQDVNERLHKPNSGSYIRFGKLLSNEFLDQVSVPDGWVIPDQSIGVATRADGFNGALAQLVSVREVPRGTLSPATTTLIPTVTDNLFRQGTITSNLIGISFQPTTQVKVVNGEISWGGTDPTKFTGTVRYTSNSDDFSITSPITNTFPANQYWGINQSIRYGALTTILTSNAGIVDTGTTLLLIASNAFAAYTRATGAVMDTATGLLRITPAQFSILQSLFFTINGVTYEFTSNAQLWPRALNTAIGGQANQIYLIVANLGTPSGQGLDFINGFAFLERFYSVYDTSNRRVGFATTPFTTARTN